MNTQISSKIAAVVIAVVMNTLLISSVAFLFSGQIHQGSTMGLLDRVTAQAAQRLV